MQYKKVKNADMKHRDMQSIQNADIVTLDSMFHFRRKINTQNQLINNQEKTVGKQSFSRRNSIEN